MSTSGIYDATCGKYDPAKGSCQLAKLTPEQHEEGMLSFRQFVSQRLEIVPSPYVIKPEYSDMDVICLDSMEKIVCFLEAHFDKKQISVNGSCATIVWEGYQLDVISIFGLPAGDLFYSNNFGLLVHIMLDNTKFSLGANGLLLDKPSELGGKFCLCQEPEGILAFMGIDRKVMLDNLTPEQIFTLLAQSPFYQPEQVSVTQGKLKNRFIVIEFLRFCESTPKSSGTPPTDEEALAFFGKFDEFTALVTQEKRSKDAEAKQANVKKQLSAAISTAGYKGKDVKGQFDGFKAWILQVKSMSYEDWAQTEPNVEEAFAEFGAFKA